MPNSKTVQDKLIAASVADSQTVKSDGVSCRRLIEGVNIRDLTLHTDERGAVCEMFDPRWGWHADPLVFVYSFTIRPGWVKGWAMHQLHEDRYCLLQGEMKVVMYDAREDSPTFGEVQEIYLSEQRRQLINIPSGVWHADENIGNKDLLVVNFPTIQYNHAAPDKIRLPWDTDLIPYRFRNVKGEA